ncbi:TIGR01666 family membrane protein [Halosquirtibacter xylanolyticus]|uniref:YccS family putative transporter n=1 Tax=Halosquirtibacter xylanolyticus TaxID=3374599 RepID=UPI003749177E|nr:TIGR01666 family membrane protein [Prolixibacteraceae bacterium]
MTTKSKLLSKTKGLSLFSWMKETFWLYPDRLLAIKVTLAMMFIVLPFLLLGYSFIGVTLSLGVIAAALSETDDHPKGRIVSLGFTLICFFVASASVELLRPYPILFALGMVSSTIIFIIVGGIDEKFRGITFGAILIGIYAMLGSSLSSTWYEQPIFLCVGALTYGLFSWILLLWHPYRLLEEQLSRGYTALAKYMELKSTLFTDDRVNIEKRVNKLAQQNILVVIALERCRNVLQSYTNSGANKENMKPYLHRFVLLQSLHERAAASHEQYTLLLDDINNGPILQGIGQVLHQLSKSCKNMAKSLLSGKPYQHPTSLDWTINVLQDQRRKYPQFHDHPLALLIHSLIQSHFALVNIEYNKDIIVLPNFYKKKTDVWKKIRNQLSLQHPRLRYAIRLSTCFLIGYLLTLVFQIQKGEWIILTSLFVCQPSYSETKQRLFQRILGTLLGVVTGVVISQLMPTLPGQIITLLVANYAFFLWLKRRYSHSVIFITIFVVSAFNLISGMGEEMMGARILDTLIGASLALLSVRFLWPDWQRDKLPILLSTALRRNNLYYKAIVKAYHMCELNETSYAKARQRAHMADNALTQAWQGMKLEPNSSKNKEEAAFQLTYLNHAMVSYLSAFGSHRHTPTHFSEQESWAYLRIGEELDKISKIDMKDMASLPVVEFKGFLDELTAAVDVCEKGSKRQKLVILYNIAEVIYQILVVTQRYIEE